MKRSAWTLPVMAISGLIALSAACWGAGASGGEKHVMLEGVQRMMFIGDSLTDGSDYPDYVVNTLNRQRPGAHIQCCNAAICGNTADNLVKRLERDILSQRPELVSICIGTNDCPVRPVADYARDLEYLIARIKESGARVLLILPSPLGDPKREEAFQQYLNVIRDLGKKYHCPVADAHGLFLQWMKEGKDMVGPDGVHHGANGFEGMARAVLDALGFAGVPMVKTITPWPDVLTNWEMSAPIPRDKAPANAKDITAWKAYDHVKAAAAQPWYDAPFAARGGWMPFALEKPAEPSVAFGRTCCDADADTVAEMQVGGSLPLKVWLNGELVWESTYYIGGHPNAARFPVRLHKGRNEIIALSNYFAFVGLRPLNTPSTGER